MAGLRIVISQGTQNIANNTTVVNVTLYATGNGVSYDYTHPAGAITIDGTSYSFTANLNPDTVERQIATASKTVSHNADGTKTVSVSAYWATNTSDYGTVRASATKTLTTIPRASTISANKSVVALGDTVTFTISKQASSFTSSIQIGIDGGLAWHDVATKISGTTFTWTVPTYYINYFKITNKIRVKVITFSGSTQVGSYEMTALTATFDDQYAPSISVELTDNAGHLSRFGTWVAGKSMPHVVVTATPKLETTIISHVSAPNWESTSYSEYTFDTTMLIGDNRWIDTNVVDSKTQSKTVRTSLSPIEEWHSPYITSLAVFRTASSTSTTQNDTGNYVRFNVGYSISPLNNRNSKTLTIRYKTSSSSSWTSVNVSLSSFSGTVSKNIQMSAESTWNVEVVLADYFTSTTESRTVPSNFYLMDWRAATGKGIAFGKVAEQDGLDVNLVSQFRQQIKTSFKTSIAMGSYQAGATTVPNLCNELRFSSGCNGSVNITTAYTKNGVTIPTGWYNFFYSPHRSGGVNGAASGDNCNYGTILLSGMTISGLYRIRVQSSSDYVAELEKVCTSSTPYITSQGTSGDWRYRVWSNNFIEVWFNGSVTFTTAGALYQGWYRSVINVTIPTAVRNITGAFADTANVQVTGSYNAHIFTSGGIKSSGTAFEAQILGGNAVAANANVSGWNVYISGYKR